MPDIPIKGKYNATTPSILTNKKTGVTVHLRQRKNVKGDKPTYFLSVNNPNYQYISSLYTKPNKRQLAKLWGAKQSKPDLIKGLKEYKANPSFETKNIEFDNTLFFDYNRVDYRLVLEEKTVTIEPIL